MSGRQISRNSGSQECFQWAEKHIVNCVKEHKACADQSSATRRLPTRILDLQCFNGSDDLRLYDSHGGETDPYATLSHCWGTAGRPLTTAKATIDSRLERIRFGDLSRSFQDAVTISRALKIRYLWIDTLCIIQDSIEDWATESAQMARIYKSSHLTISFTDYKDSHQPIFCDRPQLPTCKMGREMPNIYIRSIFPSSEQEPSKILERSDTILGNLSCLGHRAWAFQERLLSPRVLSYTRDQLIWECRDVVEHESMVVVENPYMNMPDPKSEKKDVYRFWLHLVESFSQCALTYSGDLFPTLSGIASETMALLDDAYIAGMWKADLHVALLWRPAEYGSAVDKYRAPSWSWASLHGNIKYDNLREGFMGENQTCHYPHDRDVQVLDHHVHLTTSDPLGMINEASLKVGAYCAPAESVAQASGSKSVEAIDIVPVPQPGKDSLALVDWKFDTQRTPSPSHRYVLMQVSRWALKRKVALINVDDDSDSEISLSDKMEVPYIGTLILEEAEKAGEYRRVGHAKIRLEHRGKILWQQRELVLI